MEKETKITSGLGLIEMILMAGAFWLCWFLHTIYKALVQINITLEHIRETLILQ